ncbi:MAG: KTSC domain-containing protein [Proteobacteria bacterium]|nr:KTSC domain-containing protein [Pseudomonadota bacterium]MBK8960160.1 KTSC domain-containing protein [Pseudomonadota bacterium]
MERTPVTSTNILSVGYDPDQEILEIEFISGTVYQYSGVPNAVYEGILTADSKGKYFHSNVKNAYAFVKL